MAMSSYDKGNRELAAAWLRRGSVPAPRTRPEQAIGRVAAAGGTRTKPKGGAVFHSDSHVSFARG